MDKKEALDLGAAWTCTNWRSFLKPISCRVILRSGLSVWHLDLCVAISITIFTSAVDTADVWRHGRLRSVRTSRCQASVWTAGACRAPGDALRPTRQLNGCAR